MCLFLFTFPYIYWLKTNNDNLIQLIPKKRAIVKSYGKRAGDLTPFGIYLLTCLVRGVHHLNHAAINCTQNLTFIYNYQFIFDRGVDKHAGRWGWGKGEKKCAVLSATKIAKDPLLSVKGFPSELNSISSIKVMIQTWCVEASKLKSQCS